MIVTLLIIAQTCCQQANCANIEIDTVRKMQLTFQATRCVIYFLFFRAIALMEVSVPFDNLLALKKIRHIWLDFNLQRDQGHSNLIKLTANLFVVLYSGYERTDSQCSPERSLLPGELF